MRIGGSRLTHRHLVQRIPHKHHPPLTPQPFGRDAIEQLQRLDLCPAPKPHHHPPERLRPCLREGAEELHAAGVCRGELGGLRAAEEARACGPRHDELAGIFLRWGGALLAGLARALSFAVVGGVEDWGC